MQNAVSDSQLKYPSFVFCYNGSVNQNQDGYINYIFDRSFLINLLEGNEVNIESFNKALNDCIEQLGIGFTNNIDIGFGPMSDGDVLQKQKKDMEELEKQAQMKEEQIRKEKLREQKEKLEEQKKIEKYRK